MTAVTLRPVGASLGFERPEDLLDRLNQKAGDTLWLVEAADGMLRISAKSSDHDDQMRAGREGMIAYREALRELAK